MSGVAPCSPVNPMRSGGNWSSIRSTGTDGRDTDSGTSTAFDRGTSVYGDANRGTSVYLTEASELRRQVIKEGLRPSDMCPVDEYRGRYCCCGRHRGRHHGC